MRAKEKLYDFAVNKVPGIRKKYQKYRSDEAHTKSEAWCYLIGLNFSYHVLRNKAVGEKVIDYDKKCLYTRGSESSLSKRENPKEFARKLAKYEVISFDVFDTLIFRPFSTPEELFYKVAERLDYLDFQKIRHEMEKRAREQLVKETGSNEVTLQEIYAFLEQETGLNADEAMNIELETEKKYCFANPYMYQVVEELKRLKKHIIIMSDMYLGKKYIKEILANAGYEEFDAYYVSCDYRKSKGSGELYEIVKQKEKAFRYVHVGDNVVSDVEQTKKRGFTAAYYQNVNNIGMKYRVEDMSLIIGSMYRGIVNTWLHNGLLEYTLPYEFGFVYGGLFVTGYCKFIHYYAKKNGIEKILFLARDGDILKKAYEKMYPEEDTEYVYWSRRAAAKLAAKRYKYDYFRRFLFHKINQGYTLEDIFKSMEVEGMLKDYCMAQRTEAQEILTDKNVKKVKAFLMEHWEKVIKHYEPQVKAAKIYYGNILKGVRKVVAVDIGWAGSGALLLRHMVSNEWGLGCDIIGIIAGTNTANDYESNISEAQLESGHLVSYLYSQKENRDVWKFHDASRNHNLYWELLLGSIEPSFQGFYPGENGGYLLKFKEKEKHADEIKEIHTGILDFVDRWIEINGVEGAISGRDAYAPMLLLEQEKNKGYVYQLQPLFEEANI